MERVLLIVNPKAGQGDPAEKILEALQVFSAAGVPVTVWITQAAGDAARMAREHGCEYTMTACLGGDGTLHELLEGLADAGYAGRVGYIPAGSTNDFAYSLGIPAEDPTHAAKIMISGRPFACDLGDFNGRQFVYVAAFGLFTEVSYQTDQSLKNILGHLAYVLAGARSLFSIKAYPMNIMADDRSVDGSFIYGMVCNTRSVGGFRDIAGEAVALDDGLLEVVLIRDPEGSLQAIDRIINAITARRPDEPYVYYMKSSRLTIDTEVPVPWTLDGERGGEHSAVCIKDRPRAFRIMVEREDQTTE